MTNDERRDILKITAKITALLLALVLVISIYGCFGKDKTETSETVTKTESESETISEDVKLPAEAYKVKIQTEEYVADGYRAFMYYPQLSGFGDAEIEEKVNALIYSFVCSKRDAAVKPVMAVSMGKTVQYEMESFDVTYKSEKLLSAHCRGHVTYEGDTNPSEFSFGINVDLEDVKLIGFNETVDFDKFKKAFESGEYKQTYGYNKLLDETTLTDLISQYDKLYSIYPEYYFKSDESGVKLGVITETANILGGIAEFEGIIADSSYKTQYINGLIS